MQPVQTFKALTFRLLVFGFKPVDLVAILLGFVLVHGVFNSLSFDLGFLLPAFYIAKKAKNRAEGYFASLSIFSLTPPRLRIDYYRDISTYRLAAGLEHSNDPD